MKYNSKPTWEGKWGVWDTHTEDFLQEDGEKRLFETKRDANKYISLLEEIRSFTAPIEEPAVIPVIANSEEQELLF